jgi:hypothetical protein
MLVQFFLQNSLSKYYGLFFFFWKCWSSYKYERELVFQGRGGFGNTHKTEPACVCKLCNTAQPTKTPSHSLSAQISLEHTTTTTPQSPAAAPGRRSPSSPPASGKLPQLGERCTPPSRTLIPSTPSAPPVHLGSQGLRHGRMGSETQCHLPAACLGEWVASL